MNLNKPDPAIDHLNSWIGRLIGAPPRYRPDACLGGGGMGDVFLAMDTRLGQPVALKLLKESLATAGDIRKRFERECAICAALKSQHIVQVSDYGLTPEGHPFYVMEYLYGQTQRTAADAQEAAVRCSDEPHHHPSLCWLAAGS